MCTRTLSHCVCVVGLLLITTVAGAQTSYYVNGSCGDNAWTGTSSVCAAPDGPKATIQAAINATSNGDVVFVADGVYTGSGNKNLSYNGRLITVRSANGPDNCIIDCQGSGRAFIFVNGETTESVIQGFTITNGSAILGGGFFAENAGASVLDCVFDSNTAEVGGAIYHRYEGDLILENCTFNANVGTAAAGGMFSGTDLGPPGDVMLSGCNFSMNVGSFAIGGLAVDSAEVSLANCSFFQNEGNLLGGGIANGGSDGLTLVNCAFSGNTATMGGGLENGGIATLINCTFGNNVGNGVENVGSDSAVLANCVLWGNTPAQLEGDSFTVTYSDIQGGWPGAGNIDADPLFVQPAGDDLRLEFGSPCIDAGDNDAVPDGITTDLDGLPRFVDDPDVPDTGNGTPPLVDMGAFETS
ncbi:MAG: hypothetical protein IIA64_11315 [Planctomycetes bacterium]|nr:hypothetical protein [Planctomycetota bacterium]